MRWAAGWHRVVRGETFDQRPRGADAVSGDGSRVWTQGYEASHVREVVGEDRLGLTVLGSCLGSDDELWEALDAVRGERWQDLAAWPGSYVIVARWPEETVVFGDLAGAASVYFVRTEAGYVWATAATPLAALIGGQPRLERLALSIAVDGVELYGGETPFEGVEVVPPGWLLRMRATGHTIERWCTPVRDATFTETAQAVRRLLVDGVARRAQLGRPVTADFGGVDSSTLIVLAARDQDVVGITYLDRPASEDLRYAAQVATSCPRVRHEVVNLTAELLHFSELGAGVKLPITDLPSGDVSVLGVDRAIMQVAARVGGSNHLIGLGGDQVLSAGATSLLATLASNRAELIRQARALARRDRTTTRNVTRAARQLARTGYSQSLQDVARVVRDSRISAVGESAPWRVELAWCTPMCASGWLTPSTAEWISHRLLQLAENGIEHDGPAAMHDWQSVRRCASNIAGARSVAHDLGITIHTPFLDNEMLRQCLGLAGHLREPFGSFKPLVTEAMADLLPAPIARRRTKDGIRNTVQKGLSQNAGPLRRLVASSQLCEQGILVQPAVSERFERMIHGVDTMAASVSRFVAAELWIRGLDLSRTSWWEEN
jgi:asparagine synthase (glutamine-hydrolysing)